MFPDGLQDMTWSFDISANPLPAGHVTGDYTIMTAVGQSVVRCKTADPLDMCDAMAASYDATAPEQWYSPYSRLMLEGLAAGELLGSARALDSKAAAGDAVQCVRCPHACMLQRVQPQPALHGSSGRLSSVHRDGWRNNVTPALQ